MVLPDGVPVPKDHREAHGEDHEDQEPVQIEDLNEVDIVHERHASQQPGWASSWARYPDGRPPYAIRGFCS